MSLHRVIAPPPLAIAVHPAPPPKTREEIKKEDEKRRADRAAKAKAEEDAKAAPVDGNEEAEKEDGKKETKDEKEDKAKADIPSKPVEEEPAKPLIPLRLLPPCPHRPLRSRLDLNPIRPYPPIDTDPRGAYHKYAKAMQNESLLIDVTKDGWLTEQWREKTEREALARLTGEAEKQRLREVATAMKECEMRKVPQTAEGIILELWNDLVDAKSNEVLVDTFWAKYDWSDPKAERHNQVMPAEEKAKAKAAEIVRAEKEVKAEEAARVIARAAREKEKAEQAEKEKKEKEAGNEEKGGEKAELKDPKTSDEVKKDKAMVEEKKAEDPVEKKEEEKKEEEKKEEEEPIEPAYKYPLETEWTREGLEEILAGVGIQCAFNTEKPLPKHWTTPAGAFLLISHNHFLLRTESDIQFKSDGPPEKFELLVTGTEDRAFGEMAKAQVAAERKKKERQYRDRKEKEHKERKEKERLEKEKNGGISVKKDEKSKDGGNGESKEKKVVIGPNGEEIPIPDKEEEAKELDEKHEDVAKFLPPKVEHLAAGLEKAKDHLIAKAKEESKKDQKEYKEADEKEKGKAKQKEEDHKKAEIEAAKRHQRHKEAAADPMRDADLLLKMLGPEAANIPMADLQAAFAAMEAAAAEKKAHANALGDKKEGPMIWAWHEPCERWRWRNFAAGCAVIEEGGWEERDWKAFADERGMGEFEDEMEFVEKIELDNHDWTC